MALDFIDELEEDVKKVFTAVREKFKKVEKDGTPLTAEHDKQAKQEVAAGLANVTAKVGNTDASSTPTDPNAPAPTVDGSQPSTLAEPSAKGEPDDVNDLSS